MSRPWSNAGWRHAPWRAVAFTLLILSVHRLGVSIPLPGADRSVLQAALGDAWLGRGLLGLYDLVVGGALGRVSVLGLGIVPWLLADTAARIVTAWVGRGRAAARWTRYASLAIACVLAVGLSRFLVGLGAIPGGLFSWLALVSLVAGAAVTMFMAEVLSAHAAVDGAVLLLWGGVAARIPTMPVLLAATMLVGVTLPLATMLIRAVRRVPVQYAKRIDGRVVFAGVRTYLPVLLGAAPTRLASVAAAILGLTAVLGAGGGWSNPWLFQGAFVALVLGLAAVPAEFPPVAVAENVRRQGGYVPGIRPGAQTANYIAAVRRIQAAGALLVCAACVIPSLLWPRVAGAPAIHFEGIALFLLVSTPIEVLRNATLQRPSPRPGGGPGHGDPPAAPALALAGKTDRNLAVGGR